MRVLVCGGRTYTDAAALYAVLDTLHASQPITCVIHGAADGADLLAEEWAKDRAVPYAGYPARWRDLAATPCLVKTSAHGPYNARAGSNRNRQMLEQGLPDLVVACPGGRGTANMIAQTQRLRPFLPIRHVEPAHD